MFEEIEDEDMEMIDSITEEDEDSDDRPAGFTLSEVMEYSFKINAMIIKSYGVKCFFNLS